MYLSIGKLSDNYPYVQSKFKTENKITNKLEEQYSWNCKPLNMTK